MSDDLIRRVSTNIPTDNKELPPEQQKAERQNFEGVAGFGDSVETAGGGNEIFGEQILGALTGSDGGVSDFHSILQELQGQGKLGNFELQNLTSQFNQAETLRKDVRGSLQELQENDKLGNFEIQDLMNQFNQAEGNFEFSLRSLGESKLGEAGLQNLTRKSEEMITLRNQFDAGMKDLEDQDRMGNFEIQRLMSAFNQAETLSSNVQKKMDDTISGQQQKIG